MSRLTERAELLFMGLLTINIVLKLFSSAMPILYAISLGGLALVFFLSAFTGGRPNNEEASEGNGARELFGLVIIPRVLWVATAVCTIGILFEILELQGSFNLLFVGGATILVCTVVLFLLRLFNLKNFATVVPILYRSYPALILAAYFLYKA